MELKEKLKELGAYAAGMSVLYVEDEALMRDNVKVLLESIFGSVDTAASGSQGLEKSLERRYDVILTDILMPQMNGVEMIRAIRSVHPSQVFIVSSACEESGYLLELINLGVAHFLLKPIRTEQMVQVLHEAVGNLYNARKVEEFTRRLQQDLRHKSNLLEQYRGVVDISAIVVKTDIQGRITYANDLFCQTSGYDRHEIVDAQCKSMRHPDVDPAFDDLLFETLMRQQPWHGTLKNIRKDGSHYYLDNTVQPILDEFDQIVEFISIGYDVTALFDLNEEIWQTQHEMLSLLGEVGETRSHETGNHVRRVAKYAQLLGELCGLDEATCKMLYSAAPMHDIGKIGIPDAILLKPGKLEPHEFEMMKSHSEIGYTIMKNSQRPLLQAAAVIAREHHERWDGRGYPRQIAGEEIHMYGRIVALADVFDALSCERVYKKAWPLETIIEYIQQERGAQFDPTLVDLFVTHIERFKRIAEALKD